MAASAKSIVDSLREIAQDILVPEVKSLRVSLEGLRAEMQLGDRNLQSSVDALREEMKVRDERLHAEMRLRDERLHTEMQLRDEQMKEAIQMLAQKLDFAIDIRERLAGLEARLPRQ